MRLNWQLRDLCWRPISGLSPAIYFEIISDGRLLAKYSSIEA